MTCRAEVERQPAMVQLLVLVRTVPVRVRARALVVLVVLFRAAMARVLYNDHREESRYLTRRLERPNGRRERRWMRSCGGRGSLSDASRGRLPNL